MGSSPPTSYPASPSRLPPDPPHHRRVSTLAAHVTPDHAHNHIHIGPHVSAALASGRAVVALESTIVAHGMPYPRNVETARAVEAAIRSRGAVPATVAIIDGIPTVGCSDAQLERIARAGPAVSKVSRRDIASVMASRRTGATTVSATMFLASLVPGIDVFVTGGIGGVHRGGENTMDISADLTELARTPMAVVCAGAKSVLDIPRTLEFLETHGVAVAAYGADAFPAFFVRSSGCVAPTRVDSPSHAAALIRASKSLPGLGGVLIAVPIPAAHEAAGAEVEAVITRALNEAKEKSIGGRDVTPFLLRRIASLTGGKSLESNVALVLNNAVVGADIAVALVAAEGKHPENV